MARSRSNDNHTKFGITRLQFYNFKRITNDLQPIQPFTIKNEMRLSQYISLILQVTSYQFEGSYILW